MLFCIYRRSKKDRTVFFPGCYTRCFPHNFRFPAVQLVLLYGWVLPGSDSTVGSKHYWSAVEEESRAPRVSANPYFGVWDDVAEQQVVATTRSRWKIHGEWIPQKKTMLMFYAKCPKKKGSLFYRWFDYKMHHQGYSLDMFISFRAQHIR